MKGDYQDVEEPRYHQGIPPLDWFWILPFNNLDNEYSIGIYDVFSFLAQDIECKDDIECADGLVCRNDKCEEGKI